MLKTPTFAHHVYSSRKALFGRHVYLEQDGSKCCCHQLYGEQKDWDYFWMTTWLQNENELEVLGQHAIVVYFVRVLITGTELDGAECDLVNHTHIN
jgi:hypothetical protein